MQSYWAETKKILKIGWVSENPDDSNLQNKNDQSSSLYVQVSKAKVLPISELGKSKETLKLQSVRSIYASTECIHSSVEFLHWIGEN